MLRGGLSIKPRCIAHAYEHAEAQLLAQNDLIERLLLDETYPVADTLHLKSTYERDARLNIEMCQVLHREYNRCIDCPHVTPDESGEPEVGTDPTL
jgi:hypothetical protein